ncbi:MAG: hypothetical protein EA370_02330 [Wenzhouxiangella sp.]|nr:MAG: hypothetical protein EA370_02330 [Wenzhouxiangella sp.]
MRWARLWATGTGMAGFWRLLRNKHNLDTRSFDMKAGYLILLLILPVGAALAAPQHSVETLGNESFDVWHLPDDDFMIYCRQPCEAEVAEVQAYYMNFRALLPDLIDWHGLDVIDELKPVEMHINTSSICPPLGSAAGYARVGTHRGWEDRRGLTCLFEVERGADLGQREHVLSLHEYAHVILFERHRWSYEYFTYWSSWEIVDPDSPQADPCSPLYAQNPYTRPVHELCRDHGLTRHHVRDALIELDRRFRAREGFYTLHADGGHTTSLAELRALLDAALADDTAGAFIGGEWEYESIGMEFSVGPVAADYAAVAGNIRIDIPADALPDYRHFRLDKPGSGPGFLAPTAFPHIFAIVPEGENDSAWAEQVEFDHSLKFSIQPQPFYLNDRSLEDYEVFEMRMANGVRPYWRRIEGSGYDPESGLIRAELSSSGYFAYGPRFRGPAGMFYDPEFNGHGFDVQMVGDEVFVVFFTYDLQGQPFWLLGHAPLGNVEQRSDTAVAMTLWLYQRPADGGALIGSEFGELFLQFFGGWDAGGWNIGALADVRLDDITGDETISMRLQPLGFGSSVDTDLQVTGHWFNPADSGWGLTIDRKGQTEVAVAYFYDADGYPRWALGNREIDEPVTQVLAFEGYCLGCPVIAPGFEVAGTVALDFDAGGRSGNVQLDVAWPFDASQRWYRPDAGIVPLSDRPEFRNRPGPNP